MMAASAGDGEALERATGRLAELLAAFRQEGGFSGGSAAAPARWAEIQRMVREIDRLRQASAEREAAPRDDKPT